MEDAHKLLKKSKIRVSRHLDSSTTTQMAKIMVQYGRSSRSSWAESVQSSSGRTIMGKAIWENPIDTWLGENSKLGMSLWTSWKRTILICVCGWQKLAGMKHNIEPMWKVLNKEVDMGEPTSFLDHLYLGCAQRQCETRKDTVDNCRTMFESRLSARGVEKLPMAGHAKKCVERYYELPNKTTEQLYKVSTPCIDDHYFKEEEMKTVGEFPQVCSQSVLKCWYLARSGRPDILWSLNQLERSITKWTKACEKRLNRLISFFHHTSDYKQYCHVGNTANQCRLALFQDSDFAGDLEDSKSTSGGTKMLQLMCLAQLASFARTHCWWQCATQRTREKHERIGKNNHGAYFFDPVFALCVSWLVEWRFPRVTAKNLYAAALVFLPFSRLHVLHGLRPATLVCPRGSPVTCKIQRSAGRCFTNGTHR